MNYESAVRYLLSLGRELAAPTQAAAAKFNLENITILLERLGRPDRAYPCVHIAGTNGKGSTAAFLEKILREAGFRTGLNTSPHLERINERIRISGKEIADERFAEIFTRIHAVIEELLAEGNLRAHPTYFECVTALAFEAFARERVDFAVIEVGLGGRLDATNVVTPLVSIITRVDFDHENYLGHSLREIAGEKAGILKPLVPAVFAGQLPEAREVLLEKAKELRCLVVETSEAYRVEDETVENGLAREVAVEIASGKSFLLEPRLAGRFQLRNALNAVAAARILQDRKYRVTDENIVTGIATTEWPGRLERLQTRPDVYLDGAHNPMRDKAVDEVTGMLFPHAQEVIFTQPGTPRAVSARQLAEMAGDHAKKFTVIEDAEQALESALAKAGPEDAVFITGSLYLVGELRHAWNARGKVASR